MKTLHIIRHAKSSWKFDLQDEDRPLSLRGRKDVFKVANYLSQNEDTPSLMITSHASRSLYTTLFIADEWGYPEDRIMISKNLYHASAKVVLSELSKVKRANSVSITGHNPGLTQLVNMYSVEYIDNLPTCGVYSVNLEISEWSELEGAKFEKNFFITPKRMLSK